MNKLLVFCFIISISINFVFYMKIITRNNIKLNLFQIDANRNKHSELNQDQIKLRKLLFESTELSSRDYIAYKCRDKRRIGGRTKPENKFQQTEGAWFVCFDNRLAPIKNNCNILSFGINRDESFDFSMNKEHGCSVHSFDPYIEANRFKQIQTAHPTLINLPFIQVKKNWRFYKTGVVGMKSKARNPNLSGGLDTLENLIEKTQLKNKVIDVFKMDIEGGEKNVLEYLDMDYACKYFKQFILETHALNLTDNLIYELLGKLEKCFSLFHRDSRLIGPNYDGQYVRGKSSVKIDLAHFENEINLSKFLFSIGELYFVNENFI